MANPQNLVSFKKGQSGNPNGRPKKYVTLLKESGYNMTEIGITIKKMLAMNIDQLKEIFDNPESSILEKTIAGAMNKSLKNGSLYSIETLLSRVFGKPKESADIKQDTEITIKFANGDYPTDSTRGAEKSITEQGEV